MKSPLLFSRTSMSQIISFGTCAVLLYFLKISLLFDKLEGNTKEILLQKFQSIFILKFTINRQTVVSKH